MPRDILVAILEDDVFSSNWMALLMVRDWRTRLVGEFQTRADFYKFLKQGKRFFDVLILDVDLIGDRVRISEICQRLEDTQHNAKILLTGILPELRILNQIQDPRIRGYVTKHEVGYSLSWIITFIEKGYFVFTPSTLKAAGNSKFVIPDHKLIVKGKKDLPGFTDHESEVARMAFIFSLGRRDMADELKITEQWSYSMVSELYKKMGLGDILMGEVDLFSYIPESRIIREHFDEIIGQIGQSTKARDMETLAYHLITMPEILA